MLLALLRRRRADRPLGVLLQNVQRLVPGNSGTVSDVGRVLHVLHIHGHTRLRLGHEVLERLAKAVDTCTSKICYCCAVMVQEVGHLSLRLVQSPVHLRKGARHVRGHLRVIVDNLRRCCCSFRGFLSVNRQGLRRHSRERRLVLDFVANARKLRFDRVYSGVLGDPSRLVQSGLKSERRDVGRWAWRTSSAKG